MVDRIAGVVLVLAAIPLIIYPGVLIAGLMGFAAPASEDTPPIVIAVVKSFLWLSLLYPVGYSAGLAISAVWSKRAGATIAGTHLLACIALFVVWYFISND